VWAPLLGTIYLVVISLAVATPIGVLAAVYLNEYAREGWFTRFVNLAVVNLAGVPSIVHALFGLGAFVIAARMGRSVLAASLTLAIMTLPSSSRAPGSGWRPCRSPSARRAGTSAPRGGRPSATSCCRNAVSGILTGVILQVSRAAGETAPIMFTGAVFYKALEGNSLLAYGLFDQCMALSMHLFTVSTQVPDIPPALPYGTAVGAAGARADDQPAGDRLPGVPAVEEEVVMAGHPRRSASSTSPSVYGRHVAVRDLSLEVARASDSRCDRAGEIRQVDAAQGDQTARWS